MRAVKRLNKSKIFFSGIFFLLTLVVILIWFRSAKLYGGGDIGLPTYNPRLLADVAKSTWWEAQGTGFSYPAVLSSLPFYLVLSTLQFINLPPLSIQVIFFFVVIFLSLTGMFYLGLWLSNNKTMAFCAAAFYLLNPYALMNVFHRFNHTSMLLYAYLPWTLLFLYLGLFKKKIIFAPVLAFSSLIVAYAFGTPAFLATWWFLIIFFWCYFFIVDKKYRKYKLLFLANFILWWLGLNLWWLLPFTQTASSTLFVTTTASGNIDSLRGVSSYFQLPFALRGINSFFLTQQQDWGEIFVSPLFSLLSWIGFVFICLSLFTKKKPSFFNFFVLLFLITIFISKGSSMPFGDLLVSMFSILPVLGVFRNPFEKFGILLPIAEALLFAYGVKYCYLYLVKSFNNTTAYFTLLISLIGFLVIYQWPFWTGNLFGSLKSPAYVSVPQEYDQIGSYFNNEDRILHLPLALSDAAVYDWQDGYNGLEVSQLFFPGSSISHNLGFELIDKRYQEIAWAVKNRNEQVLRLLLHNFNINYIVLHKDIDFNSYTRDNLAGLKSFLDSLTYLKYEKSFGRLDIYSVDKKLNPGNVYFSTSPNLIAGDLHYFDEQFFSQSFKPNIFVNDTKITQKLNPNQEILFPSVIINYPFAIVSKENSLNELPAARYLPGSLIYPFISLKESFSLFPKSGEEKFFAQLELTGKRLVETSDLLQRSDLQKGQNSFKEYKKYFALIEPQLKTEVNLASIPNDMDKLQFFQGLLLRHKTVLEENILPQCTGNLKQEVQTTIDDLDREMVELGLLPLYPTNIKFPNPTIRFNVLKDGNYYLVLTKSVWNQIQIKNGKTAIMVDGQAKTMDIKEANGQYRVGLFNFTPGEHELVLDQGDLELLKNNSVSVKISNGNLVTHQTEKLDGFDLDAKKGQTFVDYELEDVDTSSLYQISLQFWVKQGLSPEIEVVEDINPSQNGNLLPSLKKTIPVNGYNYYWNTINADFKPNKLTKNMTVRIMLQPWNDCLAIYKSFPKKCQESSIYNQYSRESWVQVKDVTILKIPSEGVSLIQEKTLPKELPTNATLTMSKIDPTEYRLHLDSDQPGLIVFNQTYNDGWVLMQNGSKLVNANHVLVDGYANGWIIPTSINSDLKIEFSPQSKLYQGLLSGFVICLFGLILSLLIGKNNENL